MRAGRARAAGAEHGTGAGAGGRAHRRGGRDALSAHAVVRQEVPAGREAAFALLHDYGRRLEWDTLLRRAYTVGDEPPGPGVEAVCQARWHLGGLTFRTRYVTFRPPELAAVALTGPVPFFRTWAASIRHVALDGARSEVVYTLTFRGRPAALAPVVERVALAAFRWETRRRLRALARALARPGEAAPTVAQPAAGSRGLP